MNIVRRLSAALLLAALPLAASAAHPFDGRYRVQPERVVWSNGQLPAGFSLTLDLAFEGERIHYRSVNDTNPRDPKRNDFYIDLDNRPHPLPGYARYNQIQGRRLSASEYEVLHLQDGDVIVAEFWQFLPDARQLVRRGVGKSPEGRSKAFEEYFQRID